ncbi:MAG: phenylalanine--tRNA ligase subunit alpha, partial [Microgenomates group bacterium]
MLKDQINNLKNEAVGEILEAENLEELEKIRINFLGRSGKINSLIREMSKLPAEEKKSIGQLINAAKKTIEESLEQSQDRLKIKNTKAEWLDITAPGIRPAAGHLHLVSEAIAEISAIFARLGFHRARYPEVEWDWYAFEGLNMAENHPARDEWETFFIDKLENKKYGRGILTPHTSSGQLREMEKYSPPIRMINIA